jgi:hypothetical protein
MQRERLGRKKRWLRQKPWLGAAMKLRRVHEEWVAQIDGACRAGCQFNLAIFC